MFCTNCGKEVADNAVACMSCGSAVGGGASPPPAQGTNPQQTFCTNCGKPVAINANACMSCGMTAKGHKNFCRNCGNGVNAQQVVCTKCGSSLTGVRASTPGTSGNLGSSGAKSKMTAGLLGILLGAFGAHKFYMGSWGWGIVFLAFTICTCFIAGGIITSIVGVVEGIMYLMMTDEAFAEKYSPETQKPFRW